MLVAAIVLDGLLTREFDASWDAIKHLILPGLALATIPFAVIFRITRAAVLEVMDEDYVRTAESKGLTNKVIRGRHILRNEADTDVEQVFVCSYESRGWLAA